MALSQPASEIFYSGSLKNGFGEITSHKFSLGTRDLQEHTNKYQIHASNRMVNYRIQETLSSYQNCLLDCGLININPSWMN